MADDVVHYAACPTCGCDRERTRKLCPDCGDLREVEDAPLYSNERTRARIAEELDTFTLELYPVYEARGLTFAEAVIAHQMRRLALRLEDVLDTLEETDDDA